MYHALFFIICIYVYIYMLIFYVPEQFPLNRKVQLPIYNQVEDVELEQLSGKTYCKDDGIV